MRIRFDSRWRKRNSITHVTIQSIAALESRCCPNNFETAAERGYIGKKSMNGSISLSERYGDMCPCVYRGARCASRLNPVVVAQRVAHAESRCNANCFAPQLWFLSPQETLLGLELESVAIRKPLSHLLYRLTYDPDEGLISTTTTYLPIAAFHIMQSCSFTEPRRHSVAKQPGRAFFVRNAAGEIVATPRTVRRPRRSARRR